VGLELQRIREEKGLSVEELAEKSGVSVTTIRVAERGQRAPSETTPLRGLRGRWGSRSTRCGHSRRGGGSVGTYWRSSKHSSVPAMRLAPLL
jgi:hypothetical protein